MKLHIFLVLLTLSSCVFCKSASFNCKRKALHYYKRPVYNFTVQLVRRVAEDTRSNFVFSPLTTWLQLSALAEGAKNETYKEIRDVLKIPKVKCFKKSLKVVLDMLNGDPKHGSRRKSIFAIDKLLAVKKSFQTEVKRLYGVDVLPLDFVRPRNASVEVNVKVNETTGGAINQILYDSDFIETVLIMSDANYFHSDWQIPFDAAFTTKRKFYGVSGEVDVSMMENIGYFNVAEIEAIDAKVLELPFVNSRMSMLVFLPLADTLVGEIFYNLDKTNVRGILNTLKRSHGKPVNVSLPKFEEISELDSLPELLYGMGITKIFDPTSAELNGISRFTTYASLMTQISRIRVDEGGVSISNTKISGDIETFNANKPFAYMIVDTHTEFILYAGVYMTSKLQL